ncbi:MAG TPA: tRNA uridine-5-carboxymethylaminomethyl(34) synthesis GTPase MnmE [Candidatus Binataceae bacterium]|jgi:tRNA modification GTPase|nr:tRNA uridine-5-carboxymethylaminomethyl(34) synthesis GTPase MnmE [Candidatus Binataceae bacterium]
MYTQDTIVAPATPPGRGAVAIVRLSGPRATAIARALWHPRGRKAAAAHDDALPPARRLALGEIRDPDSGAIMDRAMCVVMPAPNSLTGEDVVELHCHGGPYVVRRVLGLAMAAGARMAEPGEFSRRAYLNGRIDLTEAEAIADLVDARSESALQQAIAQLGGALAQRVSALRRGIIAVRAHLEAEIDFADEGLNLPSRQEIASALARVGADAALLHDSFARGRLMRDGARAVIVGKPNAGKSSVLNLLLGADRAIVTPVPGTTRDVIEESMTAGPWRLVLQDTAGVREAVDEVERIGVARTLSHAGAADLLIAVFDGSRPFEEEDARVLALCAGRPGVALLNKSDLPAALLPEDLIARGLGMALMRFSALNADGASTLRDELARVLAALARGAPSDGVAISRERHRDALSKALRAIENARDAALAGMPPEIVAVDTAAAAEALGAITGEVGVEDVLDAVFREFCIGK